MSIEHGLTVEILCIGNEILIGDILDTNTNWLCKRVHARGGRVARVTVLPDTIPDVASAVRDAVARNVDILFTTGGLGPTSDDLTLQAVAAGSDRKVVMHPGARKMVLDQYALFFRKGIISQAEMNPAREKMARLPEGGEPVFNPVGTAPAVLLQVGSTSIISLPGVPAEMKRIVDESLKDLLDSVFGEFSSITRSVTVYCNDESLMEPVLSAIVNKYPEIYTKSLARTLGTTPEIDIIMTMPGNRESGAFMEEAFLELCSGLTEQGYALKEKERAGAG